MPWSLPCAVPAAGGNWRCGCFRCCVVAGVSGVWHVVLEHAWCTRRREIQQQPIERLQPPFRHRIRCCRYATTVSGKCRPIARLHCPRAFHDVLAVRIAVATLRVCTTNAAPPSCPCQCTTTPQAMRACPSSTTATVSSACPGRASCATCSSFRWHLTCTGEAPAEWLVGALLRLNTWCCTAPRFTRHMLEP